MSSIFRFLVSGAWRLVTRGGVAGATALLAACGSMHSGPMGMGDASTRHMGASRQSDMPGGINSTDTNLERPDRPFKSGPPSIVKPGQ